MSVFCAALFLLQLGCGEFPTAQFQQLHSRCVALAPSTEFHDLYAAIVCGANVQNASYRQIFANAGLIHILVVSGSHLIFLESMLSRLAPERWMILIHALFTWMVGLQAPVVRAFLNRLLPRWGTPLQTQAIVTLVCLSAFPSWSHSPSFLLSWMCGILLSLPRLTNWPHGLELAAKIFTGLLPFSAVIGLTSPLSILTNWLLAPIFGGLLFPAAALSFLLPTSFVVDGLWYITLRGLAALPIPPPQILFWDWSLKMLFWIPLTFHAICLIGEVQWQRKKLF